MLRRSLFRLLSITEARQLLGVPAAPSAAAPAAPLLEIDKVLGILREHHTCNDEPLLQAALQQLVQLDRTSIDSAMMARCRIPATATPSRSGSSNESKHSEQPAGDHQHAQEKEGGAEGPTCHVTVALLQRYANAAQLRESCCRCIANMSLLSLPSAEGSTQQQPTVDVAEQLVKDGAISHVLGTMDLGAHRLSTRGQSWAATALLNLLCLSKTGIRSAVGRTDGDTAQPPSNGAHTGLKAIETVAEFVLGILSDDGLMYLQGDNMEPVPPPSATPQQMAAFKGRHGFPAEEVAAADAAMGSLTILLQAEAPENAKGVRSFAEMLPFAAILSVSQALLLGSALMVREGRNGGVPSAPRQISAVITLLPLLHKSWMAMKLISRYPANVPLVFEAFLAKEAEGAPGAATRAGLGLETTIEACLFLLTELEGLDDLELSSSLTSSILQVHRELCDSILESLAIWMAPTALPQNSKQKNASSVEKEEAGPRQGYDQLTDVLCSGTVSTMALSTAVRVHAEQQDKRGVVKGRGRSVVPYDAEAHSLLTKALQVLQHAAQRVRVVDEVVVSANTLAALQVMLRSGVEVLGDLAVAAGGDAAASKEAVWAGADDLAALFLRPPQDTANDVNSDVVARREAQSLLFLQEAAVLGQICAILHAVLGHEAGARVVLEDMASASATWMEEDKCIGVFWLVSSDDSNTMGSHPSGGNLRIPSPTNTEDPGERDDADEDAHHAFFINSISRFSPLEHLRLSCVWSIIWKITHPHAYKNMQIQPNNRLFTQTTTNIEHLFDGADIFLQFVMMNYCLSSIFLFFCFSAANSIVWRALEKLSNFLLLLAFVYSLLQLIVDNNNVIGALYVYSRHIRNTDRAAFTIIVSISIMGVFQVILRLGFDIGLVVGPHLGYLFQFLDMRRSHSAAGYARLVSMILLISYTLRIFYYFGEHFATALLLQSCGGIIVHASLIYYVLALEEQQWPLDGPPDGEGSWDNAYEAFGSGPESHGAYQPLTRANNNAAGSDGHVKSEEGQLDADGLPLLHPMDAALFNQGHGASGGAVSNEDTKHDEEPVATLSQANPAGASPEGYVQLGSPETVDVPVEVAESWENEGPSIIPALETDGRRGAGPASNGSVLSLLLTVEGALEAKLHRVLPGSFLITYVSAFAAGFLIFPFYYLITRHIFRISGAPLVGYTALSFEAMLVLPQIIKNARRQSTQGLDRVLVATWLLGDAIKMIYFAVLHQPLPFLFCGSIQLMLDAVVVFQLSSAANSLVKIHGKFPKERFFFFHLYACLVWEELFECTRKRNEEHCLWSESSSFPKPSPLSAGVLLNYFLTAGFAEQLGKSGLYATMDSTEAHASDTGTGWTRTSLGASSEQQSRAPPWRHQSPAAMPTVAGVQQQRPQHIDHPSFYSSNRQTSSNLGGVDATPLGEGLKALQHCAETITALQKERDAELRGCRHLISQLQCRRDFGSPANTVEPNKADDRGLIKTTNLNFGSNSSPMEDQSVIRYESHVGTKRGRSAGPERAGSFPPSSVSLNRVQKSVICLQVDKRKIQLCTAMHEAKNKIAELWRQLVVPWFNEVVLQGFYVPVMQRLDHLHRRVNFIKQRIGPQVKLPLNLECSGESPCGARRSRRSALSGVLSRMGAAQGPLCCHCHAPFPSTSLEAKEEEEEVEGFGVSSSSAKVATPDELQELISVLQNCGEEPTDEETEAVVMSKQRPKTYTKRGRKTGATASDVPQRGTPELMSTYSYDPPCALSSLLHWWCTVIPECTASIASSCAANLLFFSALWSRASPFPSQIRNLLASCASCGDPVVGGTEEEGSFPKRISLRHLWSLVSAAAVLPNSERHVSHAAETSMRCRFMHASALASTQLGTDFMEWCDERKRSAAPQGPFVSSEGSRDNNNWNLQVALAVGARHPSWGQQHCGPQFRPVPIVSLLQNIFLHAEAVRWRSRDLHNVRTQNVLMWQRRLVKLKDQKQVRSVGWEEKTRQADRALLATLPPPPVLQSHGSSVVPLPQDQPFRALSSLPVVDSAWLVEFLSQLHSIVTTERGYIQTEVITTKADIVGISMRKALMARSPALCPSEASEQSMPLSSFDAAESDSKGFLPENAMRREEDHKSIRTTDLLSQLWGTAEPMKGPAEATGATGTAASTLSPSLAPSSHNPEENAN
eukprot:gene3957-2820_t